MPNERVEMKSAKDAAAIEPDNYIAWARFVIQHDKPTRIVLCDSDAEGAFKVYRSTSQPADGASVADGWRCFHCDEVFTDRQQAEDHFGSGEHCEAACRIKMGAERSLLKALRNVEQDAAAAWSAVHNETTDIAKAYHAQAARHHVQLQTVEEMGYARGLADARAEALASQPQAAGQNADQRESAAASGREGTLASLGSDNRAAVASLTGSRANDTPPSQSDSLPDAGAVALADEHKRVPKLEEIAISISAADRVDLCYGPKGRPLTEEEKSLVVWALRQIDHELDAISALRSQPAREVEKYAVGAEKLDAIDSGLVVISGSALNGWRVRKACNNGFINDSWHVSPSLRQAIDAALRGAGEQA